MASPRSPDAATGAHPTQVSGEPDFRLEDWWVRPQLQQLERGDRVEHLEGRTMALLLCLARRAPRVVSKERLLEEVWHDAPYVGDEVLSHAIWELRRALGDSAKQPRFIQTLPRKGYRLLVEVQRGRGASMPVAGGSMDHYTLEAELGRGAMGVVYRGRDRRLEREVALKFLSAELTSDPDALQRFAREAQLAASLDHPNLATLLEIGETPEGLRYLVMPLYRGGSLKARLAQGPLSRAEALELGRQLAMGLVAAHQRGIVHRDIKPANLLLDEHGTLKIADFGIAKWLGATDLTRTGALLGTPAYKSPEQSRGATIDERSDLWSFGVVFFEMLTGRRPFEGEYELAVVQAILSQEPAYHDPQGQPLPENLRQLLAKCLAKLPEERYPSAKALLRDLEAIRDPPAAGWTVVATRPRWHLFLAAALGGLVVASIAGVFVAKELAKPSAFAQRSFDSARQAWLAGNDSFHLAETRRQLEDAIRVEPEWTDAVGFFAFFEAEQYTLAKDEDLAIHARELIDRTLAIDPEHPLAWLARARLDAGVGAKLADAERDARHAVEAWSICEPGEGCDLGYVLLSEIQNSRGEADVAFATLEKGLANTGQSIRCQLKLAQLLDKMGEKEQAILRYKEVLELLPRQTTALVELGNLYLRMGDAANASVYYQRALEVVEDPKVTLNLGHAFYEQKIWKEAIPIYERADRLFHEAHEEHPGPAMALGDIYREKGELAKARVWYGKALERFNLLDQQSKLGMTRAAQRAVCLAKLDQFAEAEGAIATLLPHPELDPQIYEYAARIYALQGDDKKLYEMARRAIAAGTSPDLLLADAAYIAYRGDDGEEYRQVIQQATADRSAGK